MLRDLHDVELVHARTMRQHPFQSNWSGYSHYSFLLAREGPLYYQMDGGERYELDPPFLFWNHPDHEYRYGHVVPNEKWTHSYAAFTGQRAQHLIEQGFMQLSTRPSFIRLSDATYFESCFDRIVAGFEAGDELIAQEGILLVESMLVELTRITQRQASHFSPSEQRILRLAEQLKADPLAPINFQAWAKTHGMSYSNLRLLFRKLLKTSPQQYLLQQRFRWARNQVIETTKPLSQIGSRLGYDNPAVFSRAFKKYSKISAQELRRSFR